MTCQVIQVASDMACLPTCRSAISCKLRSAGPDLCRSRDLDTCLCVFCAASREPARGGLFSGEGTSVDILLASAGDRGQGLCGSWS